MIELERDEVRDSAASSLAMRYVQDFDLVRSFYAADYRHIEYIAERADELLSAEAFGSIDRERLSRKLITYNRSLGAPPASLGAATELSDAGTLAIITGQQPGLLGGPLFVLYKVAHAIRCAEQLRGVGVNAVPIFWAASEDHDIDEVNRFTYLSESGKLKVRRLTDFESGGLAPLERLDLPDLESPEFQKLISAVPGLDAPIAQALAMLGCGASWGRAINAMLLQVFGERGLITIEPRLLRDTGGYRAVVRREIERHNEHRDLTERAMRRIEALGLTRPMEESPYANFFVIHRGKRQHAMPFSKAFSIDGRDEAQSVRSLVAQLKSNPEHFSASVRLRPIIQGACLPALAYIGGPSEIAYHALLPELFEACEVPMPTLLPRWSFLLQRADAPDPTETVEQLAAARVSAREASAAIRETENESRAVMAGMRRELGMLQYPLDKDLERIDGRMNKALGELRGRISAAPYQCSELAPGVRESAQWYSPNSAPQERKLSWLPLWNDWHTAIESNLRERDAFTFSQGVIREKGLE